MECLPSNFLSDTPNFRPFCWLAKSRPSLWCIRHMRVTALANQNGRKLMKPLHNSTVIFINRGENEMIVLKLKVSLLRKLEYSYFTVFLFHFIPHTFHYPPLEKASYGPVMYSHL